MRKILSLLAILVVAVLTFSGCGFSSWTDDETVKAIKEIKKIEQNGNEYLQVIYTDDSKSDLFLLPEGASIVDVNGVYDSEKCETAVTITLSDQSSYTISIPDGKDGSKITSAELIYDEFEKISKIKFTVIAWDGSELDPIECDVSKLNGKDGENGKDGATWLFGEGSPLGVEADAENGIEGKDPITANVGDFYLDTESFLVYTKAEEEWTKIGSIKGNGISDIKAKEDTEGNVVGYTIVMEDGTEHSIYSQVLTDASVTYNKQEGKYYFEFTVTDAQGNEVTIGNITVERPSTWLYGYNPPQYQGITDKVYDGDFYYCEYDNSIYVYKEGSWEVVIQLAAANDFYTVTFNPNGGILTDSPSAYPNGYTFNKDEVGNPDGTVSVKVSAGKCYPGDYLIPVPTYEGYEFVGWYRRSCAYNELNPTDGIFTSLTPVYEDITLYAIWRPVSAD